jgi:hypothetical protein
MSPSHLDMTVASASGWYRSPAPPQPLPAAATTGQPLNGLRGTGQTVARGRE